MATAGMMAYDGLPKRGNVSVYRSKIRVLIVDDHALMRRMMHDILARDHEMDVVGFAADGLQVRERIAQLDPDVVVLDFALPGANGIDVVRQIREHCPRPVVMVSVHAQPSLVKWAAEVGAQGYLPKFTVARALNEAVRAVSEGGTYFGENNRWSSWTQA